MKCPKCGYLGFESGDRCRNCGYDFSLAPLPASAMDLALDREADHARPPLDLDRIIGAPEPIAAADLPLFQPSQGVANHRTRFAGTHRRGRGRRHGRRRAADYLGVAPARATGCPARDT